MANAAMPVIPVIRASLSASAICQKEILSELRQSRSTGVPSETGGSSDQARRAA